MNYLLFLVQRLHGNSTWPSNKRGVTTYRLRLAYSDVVTVRNTDNAIQCVSGGGGSFKTRNTVVVKVLKVVTRSVSEHKARIINQVTNK